MSDNSKNDALRHHIRYWWPPLAMMGVIFILSAQPDLPEIGGPDSIWDLLLKKGGHAVGYGLLAWLLYRALGQQFQPSLKLRLASIALAMAYGLTDEFHQTFVPGREGRLVDVAIDGAGALGAMLVTGWLERRRTRSRWVQAADAE